MSEYYYSYVQLRLRWWNVVLQKLQQTKLILHITSAAAENTKVRKNISCFIFCKKGDNTTHWNMF